MKHLLRKLVVAKIGAGALGALIVHRKKRKAIAAIEQSEFYSLIQQVKQHAHTQRRDSFYFTTYHFTRKKQKLGMVEAIVLKHPPMDSVSLNDSLEILIQSETDKNQVKLTVRSKPIFNAKLIPRYFKDHLLNTYYVETQGSESETEKAVALLYRELELD